MTAESRARYEGIRPWFSERFPTIPPELTDVYAEFIGTLPPAQASIGLEVGQYMTTRVGLVEEMRQGTELGKISAEALFEGAYGGLTPEM